MRDNAGHMRRVLAIALPLAVVFGLVLWRANGVAPNDANAPANEFSSARAQQVLHSLLADEQPHPIGTVANARVRDRIIERFRTLGYDTTIQRRFACNAAASCGTVENIIATRPGARGSAVVLMAHYDSVGAGEGASDDQMNVAAILEIARALRSENLRNPVTFLITDGEEAGLLGAEAFAAVAKLMRDVGVVVNAENRGTYGSSNMFETSLGNRWLVRHLANALPHPQATSFFYAVYTLLPNDTDVTVFKREGRAAVNFGAIRGVNWYHTPFDDRAHASARTLQHHGENLLATARVLADADLDARSSTDATYFDLLGFTLVWWPQEWTLWFAIGSLVLLIVSAARRVPPRGMTFGVLTAFATIVFAAIGGYGVGWLSKVRAGDVNWVAHASPSIAAMWLTGLAAALFAAAMFRKRVEPLPMLYGIAIVWHVIGIALALKLGGAAFLFIVPAMAFTVSALVRASDVTISAVASTVAAILLFPLGLVLYDALGGRLMLSVALVIGILATFIAPLFASVRNAMVTGALAVVCAIVALALPAFDEAKPLRLNISYVDDPAAKSPQWIVGDLTPQLRAAADFVPFDSKLTPWNTAPAFTAPVARREDLARPTILQENIAGGVRVHVRTQRHANRITLLFRGGTIARVNGIVLPPKPARFRAINGEWKYVSAAAVDELVVDIATKGLTELVASDMTFGLPQTGSTIAEARHQSNAFASNEGDLTIVRTRTK